MSKIKPSEAQMELEYLGILESRIQEIIGLLHTTKEENRILEERLSEQTEAFQALQAEREEVRQRVERILGNLSHINNEKENVMAEQRVEPEDGHETPY
ncbi:MAG: hypothetical protein GXO96_01060 [Nitrospirae bacterium]|nr:hypothetical protein [Candidatus Manganitrophaceae bacterium]